MKTGCTLLSMLPVQQNLQPGPKKWLIPAAIIQAAEMVKNRTKKMTTTMTMSLALHVALTCMTGRRAMI